MNRLVYRTYSSSPLLEDVGQYLKHCKLQDINPRSTVFRGTLYEFHVKNLLETKLHAKNMIRCGGAYDNGIDIIGQWDLLPFYKESLNLNSTVQQKVYSSSLLHHVSESPTLKKPVISLSDDIQLVVQCKNTKKRLGASEVRQLSGVLEYHKFHKKKTVMMMVSPYPLTIQGIAQLNKASYPMINLVVSPLKNNVDVYDYESWGGGGLVSAYMNLTATKVLSGLRMEQQLQKILN
ncbi:RRG7 [Candida metapsilosis]|uniref:Required for respiratory growth protein 7, mitochondrial n=1 Tax=Candida metapsilosis TaxID=273372 RepID=A0A8H8DD00_9ASCO|nr:RRG7 [Candida metapsilosis]